MTSNNLQSDCIHIALSPWDLTDDYNRHAGVTLLSLLDHCSLPVVAHLLYDEKLCAGKEKETEYNKSCYQKITDKYNCELQYHHTELPEWINKIPAVNKWTPGSLMRLELPKLLPDVDKILYLDCDVLVLTDVADVWKYDISSYPLAACQEQKKHDENQNKNSKYLQKMQIPSDSYFNSGVLLMNLGMFQKDNISDMVYEYIHNHQNIRAPDQDGLNWYCNGNYLHLDSKYNILNWQDNPDNYNGDCIIHNGKKPWKYFQYDSDNYYWDYLRQTPWCENPHQFYKYLREAPDISIVLKCLRKGFIPQIIGSKIQKINYWLHINICSLHILKELLKGVVDTFKWK